MATGKEAARHSDRTAGFNELFFLNKCLSNRMNVGTRTEVTLKEDGIGKY